MFHLPAHKNVSAPAGQFVPRDETQQALIEEIKAGMRVMEAKLRAVPPCCYVILSNDLPLQFTPGAVDDEISVGLLGKTIFHTDRLTVALRVAQRMSDMTQIACKVVRQPEALEHLVASQSKLLAALSTIH